MVAMISLKAICECDGDFLNILSIVASTWSVTTYITLTQILYPPFNSLLLALNKYSLILVCVSHLHALTNIKLPTADFLVLKK